MADFFSPFVQFYSLIWKLFLATWWFLCPIILAAAFRVLWLKYALNRYLSSIEYVLLEIKPPRNIEKSPRIMEQVFAGLHGCWSTPNHIEYYIQGKQYQAMFSFEILGINGEMHFYVRCQKKLRNFTEALIYAQYPEAEIVEAEDYTQKVPRNIPNAEWNLWGTDYKFAKDDAYPIRTYKYFQEDVTKGMIDPIGTIADIIAALPPGHQIWFQMLAVPVADSEWSDKVKKVADKLAKREAKKEKLAIVRFFTEIYDIVKDSVRSLWGPVEPSKEEKKEEKPLLWTLTPVEQEVLKVVEESLDKKACLTKLRLLYLGERDVFDKGYFYGVAGAIFQLNDANLNSLLQDAKTKTFAGYFLADMRQRWAQRKIFNRYLDRDNDGPNMYLNSEELATIYHMPDISVVSPSIARVEAKKGGPPINLPIE